MSSSSIDLSLNLSKVPQPTSGFSKVLPMIEQNSEKSSKLEGYVIRLEDELRKIDGFKRELPLCMLLLTDTITKLKEKATQRTAPVDRPAIQSFMPLKCNSDENRGIKAERARNDKKDWMNSAQLWSSNQKPLLETETSYKNDDGSDSKIPNEPCRYSGGFSVRTVTEGASLTNAYSKRDTSSESESGLCLAPEKMKQKSKLLLKQHLRKQRRCWSPELHRRFIHALEHLGGSQAATPKKIRELMQVDGLSNDEVKSHLQKYRLHTRRASTTTHFGLCGDHTKLKISQSG